MRNNTRRMTTWLSLGLSFCLALSMGLHAQVGNSAKSSPPVRIDNSVTVVLPGNVSPLARPEFDVGPTDPATPMNHMILTLKAGPAKEAALKDFLRRQQEPGSPDYHKWLTPEAFGQRFGASEQDIRTVKEWLRSQGFSIDKVAKGRMAVNFSGTVADVQRAFHTQIDNFKVNGKMHDANAWDPSIPKALAGMVGGVVSLHNFPRKAMHVDVGPIPTAAHGIAPAYTSGDNHFMAPGDFATIYDLGPLYTAGIDGTGVTIAIVGRTHIATAPVTTFRQSFNLPVNDPVITVNPAGDPGDLGPNEDMEAFLDVEWAGAVAPGATINFVCSQSTAATDGVDLSAQYIVDNDLAPVMSTSFGLCESDMTGGGNTFYNDLWMQAAAEGITSCVASGDSGSSGCDSANVTTGTGLGVNGLSSTPYNVCVGGTLFMDTANPSEYWSPNNGATGGSALSYIPEQAWNESGNETGGDGLWATGGGASMTYTKPSWQVAPGVPDDGWRDVPDVSLAAAGHNAYMIYTGGWSGVAGTSASSPCFAGIMALVVQKTGERQGNINPRLYKLADVQYGGSGAPVFHDVTVGDNSVPGVTGFYCAPGYDQATGLGSVDGDALAENWYSVTVCPDIVVTPAEVPSGAVGQAYSQTLAAGGGAGPYTYAVTAGTLPDGLTLSTGGVLSGTPTTLSSYTFTVTATDANGCTGSQDYTVAIADPPVVDIMQKVGAPFRIKVMGSNLQNGIQVYINGSLWSNVKWKKDTKLVIKKGKTLKAVVPKGVATEFRFVNPDGGEVTKTFTW